MNVTIEKIKRMILVIIVSIVSIIIFGLKWDLWLEMSTGAIVLVVPAITLPFFEPKDVSHRMISFLVVFFGCCTIALKLIIEKALQKSPSPESTFFLILQTIFIIYISLLGEKVFKSSKKE